MTAASLLAIGLMSGTSRDGIDAALIETDGEGQVRPVAFHAMAYDSGFRLRLTEACARAMAMDAPGHEPLIAAVEEELTQHHVEAVADLLGRSGHVAADIGVIGFHGHTVAHRPERRWTWQIGDGAALAGAFGIKVVADLRSADPGWLTALEAQMGEHGDALARARADLVDRLNLELAQQSDAPFARPSLAIEGGEGDGGEEPLERRLAIGRRRDAAAGRTLSGPHRQDLAVTHVAKNQPAALCSTGEQKALLLSILLAHAALVAERRGQPPVLLLDEVAAHLDPSRRAALFERLRATGGQIWMTGTEAGLFSELPRATRFEITAGRLFRSAA